MRLALLLAGAEWRSAVNRIAETSALLCTVAAGLYPILHLGRPWFFYWNLPYPNTLALWPQFRSPLVWDAVDIVSFLVVCVSFWYIGLLPDLAALRDRAYEAALALETERGRGRRLALLKAHPRRFRQMHVKDLKASTKPNFAFQMDPVECGAGQMDWARLLPAAHAAGVDGFFVEQEPPFSRPRIEAARLDADYLLKLA